MKIPVIHEPDLSMPGKRDQTICDSKSLIQIDFQMKKQHVYVGLNTPVNWKKGRVR